MVSGRAEVGTDWLFSTVLLWDTCLFPLVGDTGIQGGEGLCAVCSGAGGLWPVSSSFLRVE